MRVLIISAIVAITSFSADLVIIIGDSTVHRHNVSWDKMECDNNKHTLRGWGDSLSKYLFPKAIVLNLARQGASAEEYLNPGEDELGIGRNWSMTLGLISVMSKLYNVKLLIQFGSHNEIRYYHRKCDDDANCTRRRFQRIIETYVNAARYEGAEVVLITPPIGRKKDSAGNVIDNRGPFPGLIRELSRKLKTPLIDLHKKSMEEFSRYSESKLMKKFGNCKHVRYFGLQKTTDFVHFEPRGADIVAGWVNELAQKEQIFK